MFYDRVLGKVIFQIQVFIISIKIPNEYYNLLVSLITFICNCVQAVSKGFLSQEKQKIVQFLVFQVLH